MKFVGHPIKFRNPVCLLVKALYGHPDAGTYWEKHCDEKLKECGFKRITDWDSLYYHKEHRCVLMVYVDDFKLSGPADKLPGIWEQIGKKIDLDEPKGVDRCLGCKHIVTDGFRNGGKVREIHWDMREFLSTCVDAYCEKAGIQRSR